MIAGANGLYYAERFVKKYDKKEVTIDDDLKIVTYRTEGMMKSLFVLLVFLVGCSSAGIRYDDPYRVEHLVEGFNEHDMHIMTKTITEGILDCPQIKYAASPPVTILDDVKNFTEDHIDVHSMTNQIRHNLLISGKVSFIDREARPTLEAEYSHSDTGVVGRKTASLRGKQVGGNYLLKGSISANAREKRRKEVGLLQINHVPNGRRYFGN